MRQKYPSHALSFPRPHPTPSHIGIELFRAGYREHYGRELNHEDVRVILEQAMTFFIIHIDHELEKYEI